MVPNVYQPLNLGLALADNTYLYTGQRNHVTPLMEISFINNILLLHHIKMELLNMHSISIWDEGSLIFPASLHKKICLPALQSLEGLAEMLWKTAGIFLLISTYAFF